MEYQEALKLVQTKKNKENLMIIEAGYNVKIILPYKDGITLMSALNNAEQFHDSYGDKKRIAGLDRDSFKSTNMAYEEYEQIKIANLLGISVDDLKGQAA